MAQNHPLSFSVLTTLAAYRAVALSTATAGAVTYPTAATKIPIGITLDTVKDTTQAIPVAGPGNIAKLFFNDSVTTGALVALDSSGRGVPHVNATAGSYVLGLLVGPKVNTTGSISDVLIQPMFKSIP